MVEFHQTSKRRTLLSLKLFHKTERAFITLIPNPDKDQKKKYMIFLMNIDAEIFSTILTNQIQEHLTTFYSL